MASSPCERARISLPAGSRILRRGFGQTTSFPRNVQLLRHSSVRYKKNADIKSNSKLCPVRISCQTCDLRPLRWGRAHGLFFDVSSLFVQPETGERCASGAPRSPPSCRSHLPGGAGMIEARGDLIFRTFPSNRDWGPWSHQLVGLVFPCLLLGLYADMLGSVCMAGTIFWTELSMPKFSSCLINEKTKSE